jgi:hypothetical protein
MKRTKKGSTIKQFAYATRMMNGQAGSKKEAALLSGFSISVAENAKNKIESTDGFKNAVGVLAYRSNNLLVAVMNEFEVRGLSEFSNKDLVGAMNAITSAWAKIDEKRAPNALKTDEGNPLRGVFRRRVETTEAIIESSPRAATPVVIHEQAPAEDMDF